MFLLFIPFHKSLQMVLERFGPECTRFNRWQKPGRIYVSYVAFFKALLFLTSSTYFWRWLPTRGDSPVCGISAGCYGDVLSQITAILGREGSRGYNLSDTKPSWIKEVWKIGRWQWLGIMNSTEGTPLLSSHNGRSYSFEKHCVASRGHEAKDL